MLRFDWLRSGHRFLPGIFGPDALQQDKDALWHQLPEEYSPLYTPRTRSAFFKRCTVVRFSKALLQTKGLGKEQAYVVFLPEQTSTALPVQQVFVLDL